jgi:acetyl esterase
VTVICGWGPGGGPRNVWIRRTDGTETVRPLRGLRKPPPPADQPADRASQNPAV